MTEQEVLDRAFAMPITNPAYPPAPIRFVNRELILITYRTDPQAPSLRPGAQIMTRR